MLTKAQMIRKAMEAVEPTSRFSWRGTTQRDKNRATDLLLKSVEVVPPKPQRSAVSRDDEVFSAPTIPPLPEQEEERGELMVEASPQEDRGDEVDEHPGAPHDPRSIRMTIQIQGADRDANLRVANEMALILSAMANVEVVPAATEEPDVRVDVRADRDFSDFWTRGPVVVPAQSLRPSHPNRHEDVVRVDDLGSTVVNVAESSVHTIGASPAAALEAVTKWMGGALATELEQGHAVDVVVMKEGATGGVHVDPESTEGLVVRAEDSEILRVVPEGGPESAA